MSIELDHLFILVQAGAPEADLLTPIGLHEGASSIHPGQGTSNRRFFFKDMMLEFLYVHDVIEATSGPAKGLRFQDRRVESLASPFGLVMKVTESDSDVPFDGWKYSPDYFSNDQCFHIGSNSNHLEEPLCICMPENLPQRVNMPPPANSHWEFTRLRMGVPLLELSDPLKKIATCENIDIELNKPHSLELLFNDGAQKKRKDFSPILPLVLAW